MGRNTLDIWDNLIPPPNYRYCPCCGVDRDEMFGLGHQASCYYGNGRNLEGAKEYRQKILDMTLTGRGD